ncbi:MAG: 16S rRNA (uracil(1498)-N(3))-methyltransferase [Clostridia bacterium]|nr:16S rRNA (uracil(1498)-N(3))-methyltransferase [Clostridia bacterium]
MYHFFVPKEHIVGHDVFICGEDVNHIKNVLRMKKGDELIVLNGIDQNEYHCMIEDLEPDRIWCKICFIKKDGVELPSKVYLFQSLPKSDKMELVIQKAVELGVYQVIPVAAKRSVVKLDQKKETAKLQRWNMIAEAAAKQSKRGIIPQVTKVMTMEEAFTYAESFEHKLIPYEMADMDSMKQTKACIEAIRDGQNIAVMIGPEGGFDEKEVEQACESGFIPITLGKRILRTETAGFTVMSWIMYQLELAKAGNE